MLTYKEAKAMLRRELGEDFRVFWVWETSGKYVFHASNNWGKSSHDDAKSYCIDNNGVRVPEDEELDAMIAAGRQVPVDFDDARRLVIKGGNKDKRVLKAWELPDSFIFITVPDQQMSVFSGWVEHKICKHNGSWEPTGRAGSSLPPPEPPKTARRIL